MDAILFNARPHMVNVEDAINHLVDHKNLYWAVGFNISKKNFSFPMLGFIHMVGEGHNADYKIIIDNILSFDPAHCEDENIKPASFRRNWNDNVDNCRSHPWKNELVISRITHFLSDITSFKKLDGQPITLVRGYVRVMPPEAE